MEIAEIWCKESIVISLDNIFYYFLSSFSNMTDKGVLLMFSFVSSFNLTSSCSCSFTRMTSPLLEFFPATACFSTSAASFFLRLTTWDGRAEMQGGKRATRIHQGADNIAQPVSRVSFKLKMQAHHLSDCAPLAEKERKRPPDKEERRRGGWMQRWWWSAPHTS